MPASDPIPVRFHRIAAAFDADGFDVLPHVEKDGCIGVTAVSRTAKNAVTDAYKRAYYVEGDNYQMGWLLGRMAEPDVAQMAGKFAHEIAFDFIHVDVDKLPPEVAKVLEELVVDITFRLSRSTMKGDVPAEYVDELNGLVDGCKAANPGTTVTFDDLWALNFGLDCLLAHVYSGKLFADAGIPPVLLHVPYMCNAVFLGGAATGGRNFFGRDFMFSTADVFQNVACMVVARPDDRAGVPRRAFVSQTAPGFVGSVIALNDRGVAMGVNMLPSHLCDPARPGLNSLTLVRDTMQYAGTADEAVDRVVDAPRGVSWLYPIGDRNGRFFVLEAGARLDADIPYFAGIPAYYEKHLPDAAYIDRKRAQYGTPAPRRGLMVRSSSYPYPQDYLDDWNAHLWKAFGRAGLTHLEEILKDLSADLDALTKGDFKQLWELLEQQFRDWIHRPRYDPASMGPLGFVDPLWTDRNCPATFYFAPQRESHGDVLIATNMAITPEVRLTMMNEWLALVTGAQYDDMQWRYDQLNVRVQAAVASGPIAWDEAWDLANFLRPGPTPNTPERTYHGGGAQPWERITITGSVSLCDLDTSTLRSLYGYYGDEPVTIRLPAYL